MSKPVSKELIRNIAIVRTDRIGDMVLTLPMCGALRQLSPDFNITMIARTYTEPLLTGLNVIDNALYLDRTPLKDILTQYQFDLIFFPRPRFEEIYHSWRLNVNHRVGSGYRWYSFLLNHKVYDHRKAGNLHEAEYNVRLIESFFDCTLSTRLIPPFIDDLTQLSLNRKLLKLGLTPSDQYLIVHPGSGGSSNDLPIRLFRDLTSSLADRTGLKVVLTGSEDERRLVNAISTPLTFNFAGLFTLPELLALIRNAKMLIANSTGVLHIASALGIPVLGLYPNTSHLSSRRWGPYSTNSIVISPPDGSDNMSLIDPLTVLNASLKLLKNQ